MAAQKNNTGTDDWEKRLGLKSEKKEDWEKRLGITKSKTAPKLFDPTLKASDTYVNQTFKAVPLSESKINWDKVYEKNGLSNGIDWGSVYEKLDQEKAVEKEGPSLFEAYKKQQEGEKKPPIPEFTTLLPRIDTQANKPKLGEVLKNFVLNKPSGNKILDTLNNISRIGSNTIMGADYNEKIPVDSKALNFGAEALGRIGGYVTPLAGGPSLLKASQVASKPVEKLVTKKLGEGLGGKLATGFAREATEGALLGAAEAQMRGKDVKDTLKQAGTEALVGGIFGAGFEGIGKALSTSLSKGKLSKIDLPVNNLPESILKPSLTPKPIGKLQVKNKALEDAIGQYNQAVEVIQNRFGTSQLRDTEIKLIKSELGIDIDGLISNVAKAEQIKPPTLLKDIGERQRLGQAAGVIEPLKIKLPIKTPESEVAATALRLPELPTKKPLQPGNLLPQLNKPLKTLELPKLGNVNKPQIKPLSFSQTIGNSELASDELKRAIKDNPLSYEPINNKDTLKFAQDIIDKDFDSAVRIVKSGNTFDNATESAMAQDVIRRLQEGKRWEDAFEVMEITAEKLKKSGQIVQASSMWNRMTSEGMLKYAQKTISKANEQLPFNKKIALTPELAESIQTRMKAIQDMPEGRNKEVAIAEVLTQISDQVPVSTWKKISSLQAMSHLLNVKTAVRNVLGNLSFDVAETISNTLAVPIDNGLSKVTGKRTVTLPQLKPKLLGSIEGFKNAKEEVAKGIDLSRTGLDKYNAGGGRTFKSGPLAKAEKAMSYMLRVPDEAFKSGTYKDVLAQQMKLAGVNEPTKEMIEQATHEAAYRTFQDNSLPARVLQGLKETANRVGTKEFGMGDFLIKYTTVPGNIISRAVEYSPLGYLKTFNLLHEANKTGKLNQRELSMTLARASNGTGMIGMGILLNRLGLLQSEDKDRNKNAVALDRAEGLGNYKLNISAVKRLIDGGDPKPQAGDSLESYNFLDPVSIAFAVGAGIDNEIKKSGTPTEVAFKSGAVALDEMLDIPTLVVLRKALNQDNMFDMLTTPITEGIPGFVPSVVRQAGQMLDPIARQTYDSDPTKRLTNRLKANIPVVREGLEPRLSPFGKEIKYPGDVFNNMINPGQSSKYNPSPITPVLKRLEDQTGETSQYPKSEPMKSLTIKGQRYELTPQQQTQFQREAGELTEQRFTRLINTPSFQSRRPELQVDLLSKAATDAREKAREKLIKDLKRIGNMSSLPRL